MRSIAFAIVIACGLAACGSPLNIRSAASEFGKVVSKNFTIGQEKVAHVGQPVVHVKDYSAALAPSFISPIPFSASLAGETVQYPAGAHAQAISILDLDGVTYYLAQPIPAMPRGAMLLINQDGHFGGLAYTYQEEVFEVCEDEEWVCIIPPAIDFARSKMEIVNKNAGFINFEIVYSGSTRDTIQLLYREYTPDDMMRAAFTQNLTYDRASTTIRFRDIQIRVIEATNESLRYAVEADGMPPNPLKEQ